MNAITDKNTLITILKMFILANSIAENESYKNSGEYALSIDANIGKAWLDAAKTFEMHSLNPSPYGNQQILKWGDGFIELWFGKDRKGFTCQAIWADIKILKN